MSLRRYDDLVQGTDAWYDVRRGMVTASVIGQLVTPSTLKTANNDKSRVIVAQLVAERITGWTEDNYQSFDMMRGHEDEVRARAAYAKGHNTGVTECGFMVRDDWGFQIGYSPDGLVGADGLIEVKSRMPKHHVATIVADKVPTEYVPQIQCGLLVTGRRWCDFISYCGGMPMWVRRVFPDPDWQTALVEAVRAFEATAAQMRDIYQASVGGLPLTERTDYSAEMVI